MRRPQPPSCRPRVRTGLHCHARRAIHSLHHAALESASDFGAASATVQFRWLVAADAGRGERRCHRRGRPRIPQSRYNQGAIIGDGGRFTAAGAGRGE
ncbi:hypothetical protein GQ55_2G215100 [Panicum hallii var. hallii]|uniref:Uncharacterized protein n=1 Tax=Panicum hallii var. hallii TaxID=1504633 RepID=A0A2T7ER24_9POAL|nr:hypothetical protein GQ55_2G215100 [Panicum hallii var. hallii]